MTEEELGAILRHLRLADPEQRSINLTGGEPTLHLGIVNAGIGHRERRDRAL